ncbi:hypothetical protein [Ruminococcus sp.]|uniref:DUF4352 domain-containing protein n=1 Tax=Ruminococcus sp. TaxID=41978 RepID=UPI0025D8393A|nr:hypothetical protein [Ruminococcus sp.]MBQ8966904.1 hypothetical protein [Ruminococcus sp.]
MNLHSLLFDELLHKNIVLPLAALGEPAVLFYEQAFLPDDNDFINTNLSSGRKVSFTAFYEVPKDSRDIELEYSANFWTDEKVIIQVK